LPDVKPTRQSGSWLGLERGEGLAAFRRGLRGASKKDVYALVDIVVRIDSMAEHHPAIVAMDCNRVMGMPRGVVVVDARVRVCAPEPAVPRSRVGPADSGDREGRDDPPLRVCARFLGSFQRVAIGSSATTATAEIGDDVGLLVVGGPTHAVGMSRPRTRSDATMQAGRDPASAGIGIREWIAAPAEWVPARARQPFDTRIDAPRVPGSAARAAEKRLRKLGFSLVPPAESFFVPGTQGPLVRGELERARRWGTELESLQATERRSTG
jgi:hypothetical protein